MPPDGGAPRLRLRPSIELLEAADGDIYLLRPGSDPDVAIRAPSDRDRALIQALVDGPLPATRDARERLSALVAAGLVTTEAPSSPLEAREGERFARQLPYLAEFGDPAAMQRRLRSATVVLLGCGGLGTWVLGALACIGIGRVVLIDDDTVELSNLNRQILYCAADTGRSKVELAAGWLGAFDPAIEVLAERRRVERSADLDAALAGADVLVLAADWPPYELARWVNAACLRAGVPFIGAGHQPPVLRVGPLYLANGGPCYECHERQLRRTYPRYDDVIAMRRRSGLPATTLGPASGIAGTMVAMEVMHLLVGGEAATAGGAWLMDMRTLAARLEPVERDRDCDACAGSVAARHGGGHST